MSPGQAVLADAKVRPNEREVDVELATASGGRSKKLDELFAQRGSELAVWVKVGVIPRNEESKNWCVIPRNEESKNWCVIPRNEESAVRRLLLLNSTSLAQLGMTPDGRSLAQLGMTPVGVPAREFQRTASEQWNG